MARELLGIALLVAVGFTLFAIALGVSFAWVLFQSYRVQSPLLPTLLTRGRGFTEARDRAWRVLSLSMLALYVVTMAVVVEARYPRDEFYLPAVRWVDTYSESLAGLAAVVGAVVAFDQWRRQNAAVRKARRDQQWWDAYKLVYVEVLGDHVRALPETMALVDVLAEESDTKVQNAAADALIEELLRRN